MRHHLRHVVAALLGAVACTLVVPQAALATENTDVVQLATQGSDFAREATSPVVLSATTGADPVVVPGDALSGALEVHNAGSDAGHLEVYLLEPELTSPEADDAFFDDLHIAGRSAADLAAQATTDLGSGRHGVLVTEQDLAAGDTASYELTADVPRETTSGNAAGDHTVTADYAPGERMAHVDLLVRISGETPAGKAVHTGGSVLGDVSTDDVPLLVAMGVALLILITGLVRAGQRAKGRRHV